MKEITAEQVRKYAAQQKKQIEYQKARRADKKKELLCKLGEKCVICDFNRFPAALDFHHLDPSKKTSEIARLLARGRFTEAEEEAVKCVVLCASCHRGLEAGEVELPMANAVAESQT